MSSFPPPPAYQEQPTQPAGEPPIWAPWYGISFGGALRRFFKKYADFSGRASRSEYWWVALAYGILSVVLNIISSVSGGYGSVMATQSGSVSSTSPSAGAVVVGIISIIIGLAIIVPGLAVTWRRLHDANLAGPFFFLIFIPIVGWIIVLIMTILGSNPAGQRFDRPRA
ncbi:hypothetical protein GCM10025867_41000 [Frondihabitans sucicola]|uniref:DUF805 domain-containing protein n=1 Tax=Frondihabitans sucicola TaxID=1268041 RepID=A0ABM8GU15_9MICO|nr:DUF805 domain-containing protein [Frondihabitans sucicola]BDZ51859.1 hypothetical protein GCM10025867_41000 [Frondihabitans sucicola]